VHSADLALVGAVHLGGGGNQRRHGYRVGDYSAEGGTRLGCVRGAQWQAFGRKMTSVRAWRRRARNLTPTPYMRSVQ
jgi:hypothetical protein